MHTNATVAVRVPAMVARDARKPASWGSEGLNALRGDVKESMKKTATIRKSISPFSITMFFTRLIFHLVRII